MQKHVDAEHIQEMIAANQIEYLAPRISKLADDHLTRSFPMASGGTIVDWEKIPHSKLNWNKVSDEVAFEWSLSTLAGQCLTGLLLFSPDEPCLVGTFEFMLKHFDELVWKAPGCRVLFGVDRQSAGEVGFTQGIIEFNGRGGLFASMQPSKVA